VTSDSRIRAFWDWFVANAGALAGENLSDSLIRAIDEEVRKLGAFSWEIGPGLGSKYMFAVSPGGDASKLPQTTAVVAMAPRVDGWDFLPAKPAKPWAPYVGIRNADGSELRVEVADWRFVLLVHPDRCVEVVLVPASLPLIDGEVRQIVGEIVVVNLVGESVRLTDIDEVAVEDALEPELMEKLRRLPELPRALDRIRIGSNGRGSRH
jgi:hypothetical protein